MNTSTETTMDMNAVDASGFDDDSLDEELMVMPMPSLPVYDLDIGLDAHPVAKNIGFVLGSVASPSLNVAEEPLFSVAPNDRTDNVATIDERKAMINYVIAHSKETRVVLANPAFADKRLMSAKQLMVEGRIQTSLDDVGSPFRIPTTNTAIVTTWPRPSNENMVESTEEMKAVECMSLNESLRAGYRRDTDDGPVRLCLTYLILGLLASAFVTIVADQKIAPLVVDLIAVHNRKKGRKSEDFSEENGSVSIEHGKSLAMDCVRYILLHYDKIYAEGAESMDAFMECSRNDGHIVMTLEEEDLNELDSEYDDLRERFNAGNSFKALLIYHRERKQTIALYHCIQIASTIGGPTTIHRTGNLCIPLLDGVLSTFCRTFGAADANIFPKQYASKSRLNDVLLKDSASHQVAVLYEKGLLKRDIKYFTPNQVGGRNGAVKSNATDRGQVSGVHLMSDGVTYSMSMPDRGKLGAVKSNATDRGQVSGVHLMSDGVTYSMSMPDRGRKGSATDPGQESGAHQFKNRPGKSMSMSDRRKRAKPNAPDHGVGTSNIQDLFLSVVEIHAEPPTPMLATSLSTMACYLCSIGAYTNYDVAKVAVCRAHRAIKGTMETQPTSEKSTTFKAKGRGKRRTFTITKHAEEPLGMKAIKIEEVKEYSSEYRQRERAACSRKNLSSLA